MMEPHIEAYIKGQSLKDVSTYFGIPMSTLRRKLLQTGNLRNRIEGIHLARHKLGSGRRGKKCPHSEQTKLNMKLSAIARADKTAKGFSKKPNGYVEITRGTNKGKSIHVAAMEERIGRRLLPDEVVHHIDGNRSNNEISNLALMTRSAHTRLHRREENLAGIKRARNAAGQFLKGKIS